MCVVNDLENLTTDDNLCTSARCRQKNLLTYLVLDDIVTNEAVETGHVRDATTECTASDTDITVSSSDDSKNSSIQSGVDIIPSITAAYNNGDIISDDIDANLVDGG